MTDEKIAAALCSRSETAIAEVIARYSRRMFTVAAAALRGIGSKQDAEEIAADACCIVAFCILWVCGITHFIICFHNSCLFIDLLLSAKIVQIE